MGQASYNAAGADGKPALVPDTDSRLFAAAVVTTFGGPNAIVEHYRFPDLSGVGTVLHGQGPEKIVWRVEAYARGEVQRRSFENLLRLYAAREGRYTLVSEHGDVANYVELRGFRRLERIEPLAAGDGVWCAWEIEFEWCQPGESV